MMNEDLESCMSYSVDSIRRDEVIQDVKMEPEIGSGNESNDRSGKDISQLRNMIKSRASKNRNCPSVERDQVEQNIGVDPKNASTISSNFQSGNETFVDNKTSTHRNRYLAIQEACDEASLVAHNLIGRLLEKFAKEQDMDLGWSDNLYLGGDSSTQQHTQEKQKLSEEDVRDHLFETPKELMPCVIVFQRDCIDVKKELMGAHFDHPYFAGEDYICIRHRFCTASVFIY